jgi:hypothetical protein
MFEVENSTRMLIFERAGQKVAQRPIEAHRRPCLLSSTMARQQLASRKQGTQILGCGCIRHNNIGTERWSGFYAPN